jgi:hypothetical protein
MTASVVDEIQSRAKAALDNSPFHELRLLRVEPRDDAISITGCVSSFYHKQLAQEAVRSVCMGVPLVNAIHVKFDEDEENG